MNISDNRPVAAPPAGFRVPPIREVAFDKSGRRGGGGRGSAQEPSWRWGVSREA